MPDVRPPSRGIVPAEPLVPDRNSSPTATSATRSTEERAFARTSFRRPRPSAKYATGTLPLPGRRTGSSQIPTLAHHTPQSRQASQQTSLSLRVFLPVAFPTHASARRPFRPSGVRSLHAPKPPRSSFLAGAQSVEAVPPHGPHTPRAFEAVRHPAFGPFAALNHTSGGGLTPACSGLASLAPDARR